MRLTRSKYRAVPQLVDGVRFASKKEAAHYAHLRLLQRAGEIRDLELQPVFPVIVHGRKICEYRADFRYVDTRTGEVVTQDVKGVKTPAYKLKKRLVEALYPIQIEEV